MSFGFSIGDIILCAQIAHRLFSSVTDGRKNAPRDLKELEDVLFGLCCALDHLQREHESILINTMSQPGNGAVQHLESMINSCRTTLEQLNNATAKYREAADDLPSAPPFPQGIGALRTQVKVQMRRVVWDLRGDSLAKYRQKLQAHTDSINILLSTFIWSSTNRIEKNSFVHQQRLDNIVQQASQINNNVSQLVQCLLANNRAPLTSQHHFQHHNNNKTIEPFSAAVTTIPLRLERVQEGGPLPRALPSPAPTVWPDEQLLHLPERIQTVNEARKIIGAKELEARRRQLDAKSSASAQQQHKRQHLTASKGVDSIQQLSHQIEHIFQTLQVPVASRIITNHDEQTDIVAWVFSLGTVLEQLQASPPVFDKQELNMIVSQLAQLLVKMNLLLEQSEALNRGVFYDASGSHIDRVFTKLRSLSTVCEKEIEEFEDEREDWRDSG